MAARYAGLYLFSLICLGCGDGSNATSDTSALYFENICTNTERSLVDSAEFKIIQGNSCVGTNNRIAQLLLLDEEDNEKNCTALILTNGKAVTAAHCFDETIFTASLSLGELKTPLSRVTLHPQFSIEGSKTFNDIAIVEFAPQTKLESLELPTFSTVIAPQDSLIVFGFGTTNEAVNTAINTDRDTLRYGTMRVSQVSSDHIFSTFDGSGSNTCHGDSGGPAFVLADDGSLRLAGITSFGSKEDCSIGDTAGFTNLLSPSIRSFLADNGVAVE
jgi:hypothetical protein